jgi:hypothetical protein
VNNTTGSEFNDWQEGLRKLLLARNEDRIRRAKVMLREACAEGDHGNAAMLRKLLKAYALFKDKLEANAP